MKGLAARLDLGLAVDELLRVEIGGRGIPAAGQRAQQRDGRSSPGPQVDRHQPAGIRLVGHAEGLDTRDLDVADDAVGGVVPAPRMRRVAVQHAGRLHAVVLAARLGRGADLAMLEDQRPRRPGGCGGEASLVDDDQGLPRQPGHR